MKQPTDLNGNPVAVVKLGTHEEIDGTSASAQNSTAIATRVIRIFATTGNVRFLIGDNPTALATSIPLAENTEIYQPINPGQKIAVLGGKINVAQVE